MVTTKYYIGRSTDEAIRYQATSGGIGTAVQKHLLSNGEYGTSLTFVFNKEECLYEPKLIYSENDINICGSVYQDIDIFRFLKSKLKEIKNGIVVTCPPCQVKPIRKLLKSNDIPCFIISFCCSGQTTIEGTWCYYHLLGIDKENVANLQYRGNGWPSGIQIKLKNGNDVFHSNYTNPWKIIHESGFFQPKRCFYCVFDTSYDADISIADPWLKDYLEKDKVGNTLFLCNTELGNEILGTMKRECLIEFVQTDRKSYEIAQKPNIEKKNRVKNQKRYTKATLYIVDNSLAKDFFTANMKRLKLYMKIRSFLYYSLIPQKRKSIMSKLVDKLYKKFRYIYYRRKIGSHKGNFSIMGG